MGFDWHPNTNDMWFTDNGRDDIGANSSYDTNNTPDDELNWVPTATPGLNYGYPWCHSLGYGDPYERDLLTVTAIADPDLGSGNTSNCSSEQIVLAYQPLGPHVAALNVKFYTHSMFPSEYMNAMFIAQRGSWDRTPLIGYRVMVIKMQQQRKSESDKFVSYSTFAEGWLNNGTQTYWGRPSGIAWLPDGSMLLSDDYSSTIYRIYYVEKEKEQEEEEGFVV